MITLQIEEAFEQETEMLKPDERDRLMLAIVYYQIGMELPAMTGNELFLWPVYRTRIDQNRAVSESRAAAGRRSGESRRNKEQTGTNLNKTEQTGTNLNKIEQTGTALQAVQPEKESTPEPLKEKESEGRDTKPPQAPRNGQAEKLRGTLGYLTGAQTIWQAIRSGEADELPEGIAEQKEKVESVLERNEISPESLDGWIGQAESGLSLLAGGSRRIQNGITQINRDYLPEVQKYLEETEQGLELVYGIHDSLQSAIGAVGQLLVVDGRSCAQTLTHAMPRGKGVGMPKTCRNGQETKRTTIRSLQNGHSQLIILRWYTIDTYFDMADYSIPIGNMLSYTTTSDRHAQKENEEDYIETLHAYLSL